MEFIAFNEYSYYITSGKMVGPEVDVCHLPEVH